MESLVVECLCCGCSREAQASPLLQANPECPKCGYVGWAPLGALSDRERKIMHRRPLEKRRLRIA